MPKETRENLIKAMRVYELCNSFPVKIGQRDQGVNRKKSVVLFLAKMVSKIAGKK
jgi:hypothetical protein